AYQFGLEWKPLRVTGIARPAAGTARSLAGKAFAAHKRFKNRLQFLALFPGKAGAETNVIELAIPVVKTQQQRAHFFRWPLVRSSRLRFCLGIFIFVC